MGQGCLAFGAWWSALSKSTKRGDPATLFSGSSEWNHPRSLVRLGVGWLGPGQREGGTMEEASDSEDARKEISDLLVAGWKRAGDRIVHPDNPELWVAFDPVTNQRMDSPQLAARRKQLEEEADQAAARARLLISQKRSRSADRESGFRVDGSPYDTDQQGQEPTS